MRDDLLALLTGSATVFAAKIMGVAWIGEGMKAFILGLMGSAGGYIAKILIDHLIKKYKQKNQKK